MIPIIRGFLFRLIASVFLVIPYFGVCVFLGLYWLVTGGLPTDLRALFGRGCSSHAHPK